MPGPSKLKMILAALIFIFCNFINTAWASYFNQKLIENDQENQLIVPVGESIAPTEMASESRFAQLATEAGTMLIDAVYCLFKFIYDLLWFVLEALKFILFHPLRFGIIICCLFGGLFILLLSLHKIHFSLNLGNKN